MGDKRAIDSLERGIETAKSGNKLLARLHLLQAVELAPRDPNCWLWLAWVAESPASAMHSLQRILDDHPQHELALLGMKWASALAEYEYQKYQAEVEEAAPNLDSDAIEQAEEPEIQETEAVSEEEVACETEIEMESEVLVETSIHDEAATDDSAELHELDVVIESEFDQPEFTQPELVAESQTESTSDWFNNDFAALSESTTESSTEPEAEIHSEEQVEDSRFKPEVFASDSAVEEAAHQEEDLVAEELQTVTENPTEDQDDVSWFQVDEPEIAAESVEDTQSAEDGDIHEEETVQGWHELEDQGRNQHAHQTQAVDAVEPSEQETRLELAPVIVEPEPVAEIVQEDDFHAEVDSPADTDDSDYGVSVLVVDDSPTVRKLVSMTLEKNGFTVGTAADGVIALKTIAELRPRLILLDITMPRLGGYQLCKLIKKHESTKHIPVIMLSGKDGMFDKVRGKFVGCDDYITKPFDPDVLVEKVTTQLTEHYGVVATQS